VKTIGSRIVFGLRIADRGSRQPRRGHALRICRRSHRVKPDVTVAAREARGAVVPDAIRDPRSE
jgi:hypothetical protein